MTAEILRRAAEVLRERANAATDAGHGWRLGDLAGANEVWADRDAAGYDAFMVATTATRLNPNPGSRGYFDALYIATMHPGVGLAVADWLEATESTMRHVMDDLSAIEGQPTVAQLVGYDFTEAIAVARAILGEATS